MVKAPVSLLEALASHEMQRRYIIGATEDEYLLPVELVNDAWHFCERITQSDSASMKPHQRDAVARLQEAIQKLGATVDRSMSAEELIERDPCWNILRIRAGEAMSVFNIEPPLQKE